ncbi:E3 ubiquitin-protein ligase WAV3-like [Lolium perenne]|uniref:E3 ubiquitin-protein ligase WAV3-like n=1 Tax=Lolium perenne TaxID=4522 RepID=UPI0021F5671F|nr:E3 ubiquitin-protein ligase WAV3-like [Lolium perenne]
MPRSMAEACDADVCAICLGGMVRGQASFVAECSHAFHLRCISASVAHGNHNCPLCKASWTVLPAVTAAPRPPPVNGRRAPRPPPLAWSRQVARSTYEDDEQVQESTVRANAAAATGGGAVVLTTHCEFPAVAKGAARENFAVLVHAKAPSAAASDAARAPLDLVTVLDVSGSMRGHKLELLKQAMGFVIDNLGPADRLSVVSFSDEAIRRIRLVRMSDQGKADAKLAVQSLVARGGTNIGEGLRVAAQVLDDRRGKNAVASIMLLSDGRDAFTAGRNGAAANYINLVPSSLTYAGSGSRTPAVHTFGFGADHDAAAMHTVAESTGGTFSFVEDETVVQDSFAQCIGGLLTVTVQEARIEVTCLHPGVRVREVKSGRYENRLHDGGRAASVDVGELYADEERRFLIFVDVPAAAGDHTRLVKVSCTYRNAATGQAANVAGDDAVVQRPVVVTHIEPSMEVERERVRVAATEDMAAAREAADRGEHASGARILRSRLQAVQRSAPGAAGEATCTALMDELCELAARVENRREYDTTGRACFFSSMSSHGRQRAGGSLGKSRCKSQAYFTPAMEDMVKRSREQRKATAPHQTPKRHQPEAQSKPQRKRGKYL